VGVVAGVRLPPPALCIIRSRHHAIHKAALDAAIAFNTQPDDSADAAARWLAAGSRAVYFGVQQNQAQAQANRSPEPMA
jgi:hypothetical protein